MLCTAAMAHPPYLQMELKHFAQHYDGPWRWKNWLEDRQRLQAFGWYPATCRETRVWGFIPRLTATYVRQVAEPAEW